MGVWDSIKEAASDAWHVMTHPVAIYQEYQKLPETMKDVEALMKSGKIKEAQNIVKGMADTFGKTMPEMKKLAEEHLAKSGKSLGAIEKIGMEMLFAEESPVSPAYAANTPNVNASQPNDPIMALLSALLQPQHQEVLANFQNNVGGLVQDAQGSITPPSVAASHQPAVAGMRV